MKFGDRGRLNTQCRRQEAVVDQILKIVRQRLSVVLKRLRFRKPSMKNQRRLDVLSKEIENPNTFQGFNTQEIRTYKKINKDRTEVLKGAGHSKTGIPLVYEQVFPKTRKLVTFGSKTSTSLVNNQGSKITHGLFDFSRKTNFPIIQLPEYLMSTVLFTRRKYQTHRHTKKNDPHPYLLVVTLLPKLPLHYYSPLHWEYPPSGSLTSHSTFWRHGVNTPCHLLCFRLYFVCESKLPVIILTYFCIW